MTEEDIAVPTPGSEPVSAPPAGAPRRVLVAGVGYRNLRDFSVGPVALEPLRQISWPEGVDLDDLSYNPVAVLHRLQEVDPPYTRLVLISACRRDREAGSVTAYRWDRRLPEPEEVQERVAEAVTGVIDLDNLLVVLGQFEACPEETVVVEVEPAIEESGERLTPVVEAALRDAVDRVRELAVADDIADVPVAGLGGPEGDARA